MHMDEKKHGNLWEYTKTHSGITCPVCKETVSYLVGEDTKDGGVMGCEACWKPSQGSKTADSGTNLS